MREYPQYKLRMPPELKDEISKLAEQNGRSMNAEIIARLEQSIVNEEQPRPLIAADAGWLHDMGVSNEEFTKAIKTIIANAVK